MTGIEILDAIIGLIFVYSLLSLLATSINEIIATSLSLRGRNLRKAIRFMFYEKGGKFDIDKFYDNPLINKLSMRPLFGRWRMELKKDSGKWRLWIGLRNGFVNWWNRIPSSYLKNDDFSKSVLNAIFKVSKTTITTENLNSKVDEMFPPVLNGELGDTNKLLKKFVEDSAGNLEQLKLDLENWYNDITAVATEWYKKRTRKILFTIGLLISIGFNLDTFEIFRQLADNPEARATVVQQAQEFIKTSKDNKIPIDTLKFKESVKSVQKFIHNELDSTRLVLGTSWDFPDSISTTWSKTKYITCQIFVNWNRLLGWLLTALAISFGSSFWFDLLRKVINIKHASQQQVEQKQSQTSATAVG